MKILFLCHRLPYPPKRGGKIRPFNMIRRLSQRHDVTVCTVARSEAEQHDGLALREHCAELHVARIGPAVGWGRFALHGLGTYPGTFGYFWSPELARRVNHLLATRAFGAVLVHCSSMGPYVAHHTGCRKVMDYGDADSEKWMEYARRTPPPLSWGFAVEAAKVRRWERWLGERFDACSVISPRERDVLSGYVRRPIEVIPNGVDLDYFAPRGDVPPRPRRLVFTGNMSYRPNVDAVRHLCAEILPRIRREVPDVELYIVGMDPSAAVRALADPPRVVVTGRVDDVRPFFEAATVAVAPLRLARGLQNKVLEAMAMRVPVVASPAAHHGISAVAGRDLLVGDGPAEFAQAVVTLLREPATRERVARAGRAAVEENHAWSRLLERLETLVVGDGVAETLLPRTAQGGRT